MSSAKPDTLIVTAFYRKNGPTCSVHAAFPKQLISSLGSFLGQWRLTTWWIRPRSDVTVVGQKGHSIGGFFSFLFSFFEVCGWIRLLCLLFLGHCWGVSYSGNLFLLSCIWKLEYIFHVFIVKLSSLTSHLQKDAYGPWRSSWWHWQN